MFVPVAVKLTVPPEHTPEPRSDEIEAVGEFVLYTVIVMLLLETEVGDAQVRLLDISQLTTSPVVNAEVT